MSPDHPTITRVSQYMESLMWPMVGCHLRKFFEYHGDEVCLMIRLWVDAVHVCGSDDIKLSSYQATQCLGIFVHFCGL